MKIMMIKEGKWWIQMTRYENGIIKNNKKRNKRWKKKNDKEKKERETEREKKRTKRTGIEDENRKEKTQNKLNVKIKLPEKK